MSVPLPEPNQDKRWYCKVCGYFGTSGSYSHPNDENAACGHFPQVLGPWFEEDQMLAYGRACAEAEREECAQVADEFSRNDQTNNHGTYIARKIRERT
jgi:hypothetical protein